MLQRNSQHGFTLMEIVVATTIFATTVTLMMSLFNYTLKINRRVEALRQVAQGTRNFVETIAREIRNGRIDYTNSLCPVDYSSTTNVGLALINNAGERICIYLVGKELFFEKQYSGIAIPQSINPPNFEIDQSTFRFYIRPTTDPSPAGPPYPGVQPFVTLVAQFKVQLSNGEGSVTVPYQTTIATDVYDIPHEN